MDIFPFAYLFLKARLTHFVRYIGEKNQNTRAIIEKHFLTVLNLQLASLQKKGRKQLTVNHKRSFVF